MKPEELPGVLAQVAEACGLAVALRLADACGGTELYIPRQVKPDGKLARLLGFEDATQVAKALGHGHLLIPLGPAAGLRGRTRRAIAAGLAQGHSTAEVARAVGVHERTVRRAKGRDGSEGGQYDLFVDNTTGGS